MDRNRFLKLHYKRVLELVVKDGQELDRLWKLEGHDSRLQNLKNLIHWCQDHPHKEVSAIGRHYQLIQEGITREHFLTILVPLERAYSRGVVDHDFDVIEGDKKGLNSVTKAPIYIVLDNIRSAFNVGSAFRTCECFAIEHLFLTGYTATPENLKTKKTSMGTSEFVNWSYHRDTIDVIQELKDKKIQVYAVETATEASSLFEVEFPSPVALVMGNERHGLSPDIMKACHQSLKIPLFGVKNSLNVGVALGACLSEVRRQLSQKESK